MTILIIVLAALLLFGLGSIYGNVNGNTDDAGQLGVVLCVISSLVGVGILLSWLLK